VDKGGSGCRAADVLGFVAHDERDLDGLPESGVQAVELTEQDVLSVPQRRERFG
jgi:hypothetical protein